MTQPTANEQLSAYLDGELTDAERHELEQALADDPALRQELARLEKAVAFLRMHGPAQAPAGFQDRVLKKVENEPMPGWWWRWLRRPFGIPVEGFAVAVAAAMVLLIALPFGLKTATQSGKDLASDPYGFVRGEDVRSSPATRTESGDQEGAAGAKGAFEQADEEPAVAALEPDEDGVQEVPDSLLALRGGADKEEPTVEPTPIAAKPSAPAGTEGGVGSVSTAPGTSEPSGYAQAPAVPGTLLAYQILTYDEDALAKLQRIAARYRGRVVDSSGATAKSLVLEPGQTYLVEVPASALAAFGDDLRTLGMVTENADPRKWAGDTVRVQVTFQVIPSDAARPSKSAPSTTNE